MELDIDQVFFDLPGALVDELLTKCDPVSTGLYRGFKEILNNRTKFRKILHDQGLLHSDSEINNVSMNPTSCGVDGAFAHQKLISTDITAVAAVAVEGLPPPIEKKYWPGPKHLSEMEAVPHHDSTGQILRALMFCMELDLADSAPHSVVMLDGSMTTPLLAVNQALGALDSAPEIFIDLLKSRVRGATKITEKILTSPQVDQIYVSIPKYTSKKDLAKRILKLNRFEDRGLLSFVLDEGEYVGPIRNSASSIPGYIDSLTEIGFSKRYQTQLRASDILYYRPYEYTPVLRLEVSSSVSRSTERLSMLLEAIRIQCEAPAIYEPYPLYMADKMVKHLGSVIPALRNTTTQYIAEQWDGPIHLAHMAMHGYRTESG